MRNILFKKYKAIAYLPTAYAILQYMLLRPYRVEDTLFLIDKTCQKDLTSRMPNWLMLGNPPLGLLILSRIRTCFHFLLIYILSRRCKNIFLTSDPVYVNQCIYYFDHVIYMEDGTASYKVQKMTQHHTVVGRDRLLEILIGSFFPAFGWAAKVEKIYLSGMLAIPEGIANKVELFNLKELWSKRSPTEQQEIIHLFLPEGSESISDLDVNTLLLTQPFSEDSEHVGTEFTEIEKIEMYRELLSGIDEQTVLIKSHPRETTNYRKFFPCATVLDTLCPMELLIIMGMKVRKAITVNSTSIYNLNDSVEKVIAAENPSPKVTRAITLLEGLHC